MVRKQIEGGGGVFYFTEVNVYMHGELFFDYYHPA